MVPSPFETLRSAPDAPLCAGRQDKELREAGKLQGGVLTPASAMGGLLLERLKQYAGTTFTVDKDRTKA